MSAVAWASAAQARFLGDRTSTTTYRSLPGLETTASQHRRGRGFSRQSDAPRPSPTLVDTLCARDLHDPNQLGHLFETTVVLDTSQKREDFPIGMFSGDGGQKLEITSRLGSGEWAVTYMAMWKGERVVVKVPKHSPMAPTPPFRNSAGTVVVHKNTESAPEAFQDSDRHRENGDARYSNEMKELYVHVNAFCASSPHALAHGEPICARIAEPKFVLRARVFWQEGNKKSLRDFPVLGMEFVPYTLVDYLDSKLVDHVDSKRKLVIRERWSESRRLQELQTVIRQISCLLQHLQSTIEFVHGDLHAGNVLVQPRGANKVEVYLIDFGYSSMRRRPNGKRLYADDEMYAETSRYNPSLDLLFLLTSCRDMLAFDHPLCATLCDRMVSGFWKKAREELGKLQHSDASSDAWRKFRTKYVLFGPRANAAHHFLYDLRVDWKRCNPTRTFRFRLDQEVKYIVRMFPDSTPRQELRLLKFPELVPLPLTGKNEE